MDILFISKFILVIAIIIMLLATLRASAYKSTSMGLLIGGELYNLAFYRDISLALIFFGFVGTIAFAVTVGGEDK